MLLEQPLAALLRSSAATSCCCNPAMSTPCNQKAGTLEGGTYEANILQNTSKQAAAQDKHVCNSRAYIPASSAHQVTRG
jgi:hypothetical protein